ncbi:hypothetical protein BS47DRAFT_1425958 [Hydnum rufescens UP504]|uniref:Glucosidase 2 subunit beta n=1 Tax=Hydnum rufescens UP504 TaxID=1448309 RepID=A0A9P6AIQ0_9AGAM|nr:hypothetical protein BS47DRAFT_1425958 [Hydnum rufescens UP504]
MARIHYLLVLAVFSPSLALKGIKSSHLSLYSPVPGSSPPLWKCLNSSQEILYSALNDDYCDCEDGTDEPGTSACPGALFYCVNEGHIGAYIRSSRVHDGLCEPECCDGSDEPEGVCPNVCVSLGNEHRRVVNAERKMRKTGSKIRSSYITHAQREKKRLEDSIQSLKTEVALKEIEEARAQEIWEHTASMDAEMLEIRRKSPTYRLLSDYVALIDAMIVRENMLNERITALEAILETLSSGYNPNYQDMAVLEAVRGWAALKGSEEPKETESTAQEDTDTAQSQPPDEEELIWTDERIVELKDTDALSALLEHERHIGSLSTEDFSEELLSLEHYIPEPFLPTFIRIRDAALDLLTKFKLVRPAAVPPGASGDSDKKKTLHQNALNALNVVQTSLADEERALHKLFDPVFGFGKYGEWKKLDGTCIEKDSGEYTYSVCFFGSVTQKPNKGGGTHSLGRFSSWSRSPSDHPEQLTYYSRQIYGNGERCWNGPERSVQLELSCGTENTLLTIAEPEKCEYHFTATTPALCWPDSELDGENQKPLNEDL